MRYVDRSTKKKRKVLILVGVYGCRMEKSTGKWGSGVAPQLRAQVMEDYYTPLWRLFPARGRQRGARGDFITIILKSPCIPLCQRGIKILLTEGVRSGADNEKASGCLIVDILARK
jgi:hypothetical protein